MAPKKQFTRNQIIDLAFEVAKVVGIEGLTARNVAEKMGSSVAPIYVNFSDLEDLKRAVVRKVFAMSRQMLQQRYTGDRFLDIGIASLRFAREYSVFFRELVLQKSPYMDSYQEELGDDVLGEMAGAPDLKGFTAEELNVILLKARIFQVGLSAMVANGMLPPDFDEPAQIDLLKSIGEDLLAGARVRKQGPSSLPNCF